MTNNDFNITNIKLGFQVGRLFSAEVMTDEPCLLLTECCEERFTQTLDRNDLDKLIAAFQKLRGMMPPTP